MPFTLICILSAIVGILLGVAVTSLYFVNRIEYLETLIEMRDE